MVTNHWSLVLGGLHWLNALHDMMVQSFLEAVGGRGMGALELVAMDMKARGMYVCRTLSFAGETPPPPPRPSQGPHVRWC